MTLPAQDRAEWHAALEDPHLPDRDYDTGPTKPYDGPTSEDPWQTSETTCSPW